LTKILYLDTACTAFAERSKDPNAHWQPHCARIAALLEDTEASFMPARAICRLIRPEEGWEMGATATAYHKADAQDFAEASVPATVAANEMNEFLSQADLLVSHNKMFHQKVLTALFADAKLTQPPIEGWGGVCTMVEAMPVMRLATKNTYGYKQPKLTEAFEFFAGTPMPVHVGWYPFGSTNVKAVRVIYKGLQKRKEEG
jgi:DNA polymerase III subunit epsilon